jgi:hypothetical protein
LIRGELWKYGEYNVKRGGFLKFVLIVFIIIFIFNSCTNYIHEKAFDKEKYNLADDADALPKPIQKRIKKEGKILVGNTEVHMVKKAKYKIIGRVVSTEEHTGTNIDELLSPRDLALAWGVMSLDRNHKKMEYNSEGREYIFRIVDNSLVEEYETMRVTFTNSSNNHIVPADENTRKILNEIKIGNIVLIEGYLVTLEWNQKGDHYYWGTSMTRNDTRDNSCELIYTNNIKIVQ